MYKYNWIVIAPEAKQRTIANPRRGIDSSNSKVLKSNRLKHRENSKIEKPKFYYFINQEKTALK